jgi:hypothetical protein
MKVLDLYSHEDHDMSHERSKTNTRAKNQS